EIAADALQQSSNRRFAGTAAADDAEHRAGRYLEADPVERGCLGAGIGEAYVVEGDRSADTWPQAAGTRIALERPVQHRCGLTDGRADLLVVLEQLGQTDRKSTRLNSSH